MRVVQGVRKSANYIYTYSITQNPIFTNLFKIFEVKNLLDIGRNGQPYPSLLSTSTFLNSSNGSNLLSRSVDNHLPFQFDRDAFSRATTPFLAWPVRIFEILGGIFLLQFFYWRVDSRTVFWVESDAYDRGVKIRPSYYTLTEDT